jgi:hypothetical protein
MKKSDFMNLIKEAQQGSLNPKNMDMTRQNLEKVNQQVEKFKLNMMQLKNMGVFEEDFDTAKNYDSTTEFFMDMIDSLMNKKYGLTYFKEIPGETESINEPEVETKTDGQLSIDFPKEKPVEFPEEEKTKPISQMSDSELKDFQQSWTAFGKDSSLNFVINLIKKGLERLKSEPESENGVNHPLRQPYITLQDLMRKKLEENLVDSKIFSIIAEAETPKISKKEILEFLNRK